MARNETFKQRIPPTVVGIQVNYCKNPECANFGSPAVENIKGAPLPSAPCSATGRRHRDNYTIDGKGSRSPRLKCHFCGQKPPIKSNLAIYEELSRMEKYLIPIHRAEPSCKTPGCSNFGVPLSAGKQHYQRHGQSTSGSIRYLCKECASTFSVVTVSTHRQRTPEINALVFKLLVNKMPFQRICEVADINISTLYDKIDFLYRQCQAFAAAQERQLPLHNFYRLEISVDAQEYVVNWTNSADKKNVVVSALGSADNLSGFVFGMHINLDPALNPSYVEADAKECGDNEKPTPFRKYARLWLENDYCVAAGQTAVRKPSPKAKLPESIVAAYNDEAQREDIESFEAIDNSLNLPRRGMQIHGDYTMYGHFQFLKRLLCKTHQFRFYMEKESAIRAACLSAFVEEIKEKRCEAFYVRINKEMTIHEKEKSMSDGKRLLDEFRASNSSYETLTDYSLRTLLLEQMIKKKDYNIYGVFKDKWYNYPAPPKNEPEKAISWLTDTGSGSVPEFKLAKMFLNASLFGIDRFFMQVRRRISLLERPIGSSSASGRKWYGYSPYNPAHIVKVLEIFRVYHNYIHATANETPRKLEPGEEKRRPGTVVKNYTTPAMRLGITLRPYTVNDVIDYMELANMHAD